MGRLVLNENAKKAFVAICFRLTEKNWYFDWTIKKKSVKFWDDLLYFQHFMQIFVFVPNQ